MRALTHRTGACLIELLLAAVIGTVVVVTLSLAFPKASANTIQNQRSMIAGQLASSQLTSLKTQMYENLDTTDADSHVDSSVQNAFKLGGCDCRAPNGWTWSQLPSTSTVVGRTSYSVASCIHYVNPASSPPWAPECTPLDPGYKELVVQVAWSNGAQNYSLFRAGMVTRN